jgi:hypothetical protein
MLGHRLLTPQTTKNDAGREFGPHIGASHAVWSGRCFIRLHTWHVQGPSPAVSHGRSHRHFLCHGGHRLLRHGAVGPRRSAALGRSTPGPIVLPYSGRTNRRIASGLSVFAQTPAWCRFLCAAHDGDGAHGRGVYPTPRTKTARIRPIYEDLATARLLWPRRSNFLLVGGSTRLQVVKRWLVMFENLPIKHQTWRSAFQQNSRLGSCCLQSRTSTPKNTMFSTTCLTPK